MASSSNILSKIPQRAFAFLVSASLILVVANGCRTSKGRGGGQRYDLKGKVVSVNKTGRKVTIDHEPVEGLMEAMVMDFTLDERDALQIIEAGDHIQATLIVSDDGFWLEEPRITKGLPAGGVATANLPGLKPGDEVPAVELVNQDGKRIRLSDYRGRALLLTFIYTRCPLAEYCPLMSERFAAIERELQNDTLLKDKTHLLSVSIAPEHDTPEVLRSYGSGHTGRYSNERFEHWSFATGEPDEVRRLAQFFGLEYFAEKDQIVHTLSTALIDPAGRIHKVYRGNEWQTSEVINDVRELVSHTSDETEHRRH